MRDFGPVNYYPQHGQRSGEIVGEVFVKEYCGLVIDVFDFDPVTGFVQDIENEFIWET
jgi:hypothetical protein